VKSRRPILEDQLTQIRALDRLTGETLVERRPTVIANLERRGGRVILSFDGKELSFPAHAQAELEHAALAVDPFTAAELPGELDESGRLVLVRRLVREGFLRISRPGSGGPASA
jgi:hypothetical protein